MLDTQSWQTFVTSTDRKRVALMLGALLALIGGVVGVMLALTGPIITVALLAALLLAVWALTNLEIGTWGMVAVIALLPLGTLPFKIVLTPTFLDLAMGGVFAVYLMQWMTGQRRRLVTTPLHTLILAFMLLVTFNFVMGLRYAGLTSTLLRFFAELLLSITLALLLVDMLRAPEQLKRLALVLMVAGTASALLGIILYVMPDALAESVLVRLSVFGYPDGGVISYIESLPWLPERAISTWVEPNRLGGFLVIVAALIAPQLGTRYPVVRKRWIAAAMLAVVVVCLVLTYSRGAMLGFAAALMYIAALRYRRLLLVMIVIGGLLLALPFTQDYLARFVEGAQGADLATQMRFGEYGDAVQLIARYPVVGVGFGGSPDIDLYLGVSSIYLYIAEAMGLVGLVAFLLVMVAIFAYATAMRHGVQKLPGLEALRLGLTAALLGILVSGIFDHYFFNIEFHHAVTMLWLTVGLTLTVSHFGQKANLDT
jgi:O-antigen ligase